LKQIAESIGKATVCQAIVRIQRW